MISTWLQRPIASSGIKITLIYIICMGIALTCLDSLVEKDSWWASFSKNAATLFIVAIQWKELTWLRDLKKQK